MSKKKFKITKVERIQYPLKYKSYYFNLFYCKEKLKANRLHYNKETNLVENEELKVNKEDRITYGDYYPFDIKYGEGGNSSEEEGKEERKEESKEVGNTVNFDD